MMSIAENIEVPQQSDSLRKKMVVGAVWTFVGYGGAQVIRLISNLVLTRLLAPEYFGAMTLITMLLVSLAMFSDLGIGPSIMQNERADDQAFLDTAFTLQFIRGCVMWVACLIAAYPFAKFYNEPQFVWLVPVVGFSVVISGLTSTKTASINRQVLVGKLTAMELGSQALTTIFTVAFAWISPTIWSIAFASLFGSAVKMLASHLLLPGRHNRFRWDRTAVRSLIRFGRWIFVGTALSFASNFGGTLIIGKLVTMTEVGIFSMALTLSKIVEQAFEQINNKIFMPALIRIKDLPVKELRQRLFKIRLSTMTMFLPPLWLMTIFGQQIFSLLFDKRYHGGGWMLQVLSVGSILSIIYGSSNFYLAKGNSFLMMALSFTRFVCYLSSLYIGWLIDGSTGVIVGMALFLIPVYFVEVWAQRKYSIMMLKVDMSALFASAAIVGLGLKATGQF